MNNSATKLAISVILNAFDYNSTPTDEEFKAAVNAGILFAETCTGEIASKNQVNHECDALVA